MDIEEYSKPVPSLERVFIGLLYVATALAGLALAILSTFGPWRVSPGKAGTIIGIIITLFCAPPAFRLLANCPRQGGGALPSWVLFGTAGLFVLAVPLFAWLAFEGIISWWFAVAEIAFALPATVALYRNALLRSSSAMGPIPTLPSHPLGSPDRDRRAP